MPFGKAGIEWLKSDTCLIDNDFEWGGGECDPIPKSEQKLKRNSVY